MAAGVLAFTGNLALQTNSSFVYSLIWEDSTGNPINLTGYEAKMSVGNTIPPTQIYITLNSTGMSPAITFDPTQGQINLTLTASQVASAFEAYLVNGTLNTEYDLLLYPPAGNEFVFLKGPMQINDGITTP